MPRVDPQWKQVSYLRGKCIDSGAQAVVANFQTGYPGAWGRLPYGSLKSRIYEGMHRFWSTSCGGKLSNGIPQSLGSAPLWKPKVSYLLGKCIEAGAEAVVGNFRTGYPRA